LAVGVEVEKMGVSDDVAGGGEIGGSGRRQEAVREKKCRVKNEK